MYIESGKGRGVRCAEVVSDDGAPRILNELNNLTGLLGSTLSEAVLLAEALRPVSGPEPCISKQREEKPRRDPSTALDYIEILKDQVDDLRTYLVKTRDMLVI
jgi:hypothetical protein